MGGINFRDLVSMALTSLLHHDISAVFCVRKKDLIFNGDYFTSAFIGIGAQLTFGTRHFCQKMYVHENVVRILGV